MTGVQTCALPIYFYAETVSGNAPLTVQFYDLSTNATSWNWQFGDGGTSTEQDPVHIYTRGGTFTVTLVASNSGSSDTLVSTDLITVTGTNSLEKTPINKYAIRVVGNSIHIDGIERSVEIFSVDGQRMQSQIAAGSFVSSQLKAGVYLVKIDNYMSKILIK